VPARRAHATLLRALANLGKSLSVGAWRRERHMPDFGKSDVFVDLGVQRDYLNGNPTLRCRNATSVTSATKRLMALARWSKLPVLSCVDVHRPHDIGDQFVEAPADASPREKMLPFARLSNYTVVESDNCLCIALDVLEQFQQAIFTKVQWDPFTNPKLDRLLTEMPAQRFVLFGVPLESSVRLAVLGLIRRCRRVAVISDACGFFSDNAANMVLRQLGVKGCEVMTSDAYLRSKLAEMSRRERMKLRSRRFVA
jgi:nicotinamidase-related amidase